MRMWLVKPSLMCNQHLLGEHVEMHMFVGTINRGKSIEGYIKRGLVETSLIEKRHKDLAIELKKRGFNHKSNLPKFNIKSYGNVDKNLSLIELKKRCVKCKSRIVNNRGILDE
ncbi:MAG: pyrimidine dimer DNA glycosylase/endonuclease V [Candidatus Pacearchaeota archaeon]|jgi:hypothetical protein